MGGEGGDNPITAVPTFIICCTNKTVGLHKFRNLVIKIIEFVPTCPPAPGGRWSFSRRIDVSVGGGGLPARPPSYNCSWAVGGAVDASVAGGITRNPSSGTIARKSDFNIHRQKCRSNNGPPEIVGRDGGGGIARNHRSRGMTARRSNHCIHRPKSNSGIAPPVSPTPRSRGQC